MRITIFFTIVIIASILFLVAHINPSLFRIAGQPTADKNTKPAKILMLTDLAIWTESRYTRHPSQADVFSSFQDSPASLEHFPAGSFFAPPRDLMKASSQ